jgi:hypothetical protein
MYYMRYLHPAVWSQRDHYRLKDGERWHKKYAYYYSWSYRRQFAPEAPSDLRLRIGHDWHGLFESRQAAFTMVCKYHGPAAHPSLPQKESDEWRDAWEWYAAKTGLTVPVFVQ